MNFSAIINPASRVGRTGSRVEAIGNAMRAAGHDVELFLSEHPGHARELAREQAKKSPVLVAVGGDGTVHEVAHGILDSGESCALGVLPVGTGNDFARMIGSSEDLETAVQELNRASIIPIDVGGVAWTDEERPCDSIFVNALGIGFDAHAAHIAPRFKALPSQLGYLSAILVALTSWNNQEVTVTDKKQEERNAYSGPLFFVTVGNARDSGGGYTINPKASLTDGLLDVCLVKGISRLRAVRMLPSARTGDHLLAKEVDYWQTTAVRLDSVQGLPIHTDGEVRSTRARNIEVMMDKNTLNVLVPNRK